MQVKEFEKKLERANKNLEKLLNPNISLSDGMKNYKEGIKELEEAQELLQSAKIEYEEIKRGK